MEYTTSRSDKYENINRITTIMPGVYGIYKKRSSCILTKYNINRSNINDKLFHYQNEYYREWDPNRSKLCVLYKKKSININFQNKKVLYLGASFGTTIGYISDIMNDIKNDFKNNGIIYAVELSEIPMESLLLISEKRENIIPILGDANFPERYNSIISHVDIIFQDISQYNQIQIATKNMKMYLKKDGYLILIIKARSISSTKNIGNIYKEELKKLSKNENLKIIKKVNLSPYYNDHLCVILQ